MGDIKDDIDRVYTKVLVVWRPQVKADDATAAAAAKKKRTQNKP